jgi:FixJ family two-component response regulator
MVLKVYYLDDEPILCSLFIEEFESAEIEVTTFVEYQKLIDASYSNPPDVIFLDYRLPGINGDQVALKMASEIPKYLITGDLHVKTTYKFVATFQKPYDEEDLHQVLQMMLKNKR